MSSFKRENRLLNALSPPSLPSPAGLSFRDVAGFLVGILAGALMMLLSSYMRWRSERLEQEAAAARQQPLLAPLHPHPQLLVPALARSQKGASGGESTDPASSADTPRLGLPALVQPAQSGSLPSTVAGATSSGGSGTVLSEGSDGLPRRPTSELRMLEEFVLSVREQAVLVNCLIRPLPALPAQHALLCLNRHPSVASCLQLVKRGSNQESKSSTGGSHASAGQLGAPASLSLVQGADVLSPHPKTTDLAKLPSGFADG